MDIITRLLLLSVCGAAAAASEPLGRLLQRRRDAFQVYAREFAQEYEPYMFAAVPLHAPVPVLRVLSRAPLPPPRPRPRDALAASSTRHAAVVRPYYSEPAAAAASHYQPPTRHYSVPPQRYAAPEPDYEASSYDYSRDYARPIYYRQKPRRHAEPTPSPAPAYSYAAEYDSYAPQPQLQIAPSPLPQLTYAMAPAPAYESVAYAATQEAAPTVLYARPSPTGGFTYRRVPPAHNKPLPGPLKDKESMPYIIKIHKYRIVKDLDLI